MRYSDSRIGRITPGWWAAITIAVIVAIVALTSVAFNGTFRSAVPVTLTSDRAGLVLEPGAKVKLRGVQVGVVSAVHKTGTSPVTLRLELDPAQLQYIPANVQAQIRATTAFGAKYVDLTYPSSPAAKRLTAGTVLKSTNVSTEVNTVFENLTSVLHSVDPAKLNAVLTALADGVRGRGQRIGEAITDSNEVLLELNPRLPTIQSDFQSLRAFSDAYANAAPDLIKTLSAITTTSTTITDNRSALDALLLNVAGMTRSGVELLAPSQDSLVKSVNLLAPTTALLLKYNPVYTCTLLGAQWWLDNAAPNFGGNGKSAFADGAILLGSDPYRYPDNLPLTAAKGGPGGKPSCGSLPDPTKNFPVQYLVTNTGWGTGLDMRPNPGIAHPLYGNWFPVTRAVPEPPSIRGEGPPAPGPPPAYPGEPAYGAPRFIPPPPPGSTPPPPPPPPPSVFEVPPQ